MFISKLGKESEIKEKEIKKICSDSTFERILRRGEIIFCMGAKGINAPKETCTVIGNIWDKEICVATNFYLTDHSGYYYSVDTEKMIDCPYRKTDSK